MREHRRTWLAVWNFFWPVCVGVVIGALVSLPTAEAPAAVEVEKTRPEPTASPPPQEWSLVRPAEQWQGRPCEIEEEVAAARRYLLAIGHFEEEITPALIEARLPWWCYFGRGR